MSAKERAEKIVNECSKRWIEESPDGFGCNLDLLSKEIEYHLIEAKREGMEEAAKVADGYKQATFGLFIGDAIRAISADEGLTHE